MSIKLSDSIRVGQQKPLEDKYFNELVPYTSTIQVNTLVPIAVRHIGLTVNIDGEEYWYKDGIEDANLVLKVPNIDTTNFVTYTGATQDVNIASNYFKTSKGFDFTKDAENFFKVYSDNNIIIFEFVSTFFYDNNYYQKLMLSLTHEDGISFTQEDSIGFNRFNITANRTYSTKKFVTEEGFEVIGGTANQSLTANGGVFDLNTKADLVSGKVPATQLPSYVDDVLEFANLASFPATGENGKIYIAIDTNLTYRWGGSSYVVMSSSLALGETSSTAYRGDRGKMAYDHSQTTGNPHGTTKNDIGLSNVDNTSDLDKPISTATQTALNNKLDKGTYTGNAQDLKNDINNLRWADIEQEELICELRGELDTEKGRNDAQDSALNNLEGIHYVWSPTNRTLTLFDRGGTQLSQVSLVSLDDEGTSLKYNDITLSLELYNEADELLTSIPVSSFIGSVGTQLQLNSNQLQLKDNQGNILSTVSFAVSNIDGLQDFLDNELNNYYIKSETYSKTEINGFLSGKQNAIGYTPENLVNKATDLSSPDNTKYPTTLAVVNENKKATITVELISQLTTNFYAPNALRINSTALISGSGTLTLKVNDVAYTLTDLIPQGSKITAETTSSSVYNLISIYE